MISVYNTTNQAALLLSAMDDKGFGELSGGSTSYLLGVPSENFQINDITIIFRPKRVK